jgi:hypothetical protein
MIKRVDMNSMLFHKLLTDEQGGGVTVYQSCYGCAMVLALKVYLDFEMRAQWFQFKNNIRMNTVTGIKVCINTRKGFSLRHILL